MGKDREVTKILETSVRRALSGVPKILYLDNGSTYCSRQFAHFVRNLTASTAVARAREARGINHV